MSNPWQAQPVRIRAITPELAGVLTYHLEFVDPEHASGYSCLPGQFNMLYLPGVGEVPISVSGRDLVVGAWAHTIRTAGNTTAALARLPLGAQFGLRGPYGTSWPMADCAGADVLLVAGGIGLAPLRPAIHAILEQRPRYGTVTLIYGARSPHTLLYADQFADWSARGINLQTTVDRAGPDWHGNVGVVPLLVERLHPLAPRNTVVLTCGPEVMMRYTVQSAMARGIDAKAIYLSLERNMQCAVGLCGHCQLGPAFICKDGPVFRHDRIAPYLSVESL